MSDKSAHKRTKILISPRYQIRFATFSVLFLLPIAVLNAGVIWNLFDFFNAVFERNGISDPLMQQFRQGLLFRLIGLQALFLVLVALIALYLSHKTAGPLEKLKKAMLEYAESASAKPLTFRKGDFFTDVADTFNEMTSKLQNKVAKKD